MNGEPTMQSRPTRRSVMAAIGTAAAGVVSPPTAVARENPGGDIAYRTAGELVRALADRRLSSRELVDAVIVRIEALDSKINAVVVRDFDRARADADAADAALAKGD